MTTTATTRPKTVIMRDAIATWKQIHTNYLSMQHTAMQLFSHPDATDEQVLHVARKLGEVRMLLINTRQQIVRHPAYYSMWLGVRIDEVKL